MSREISLAQVIEAIEKGGYKQGFNHLMESDSHDGKNVGLIIDADPIGQAALNLGIEDVKLSKWLQELKLPRKITTNSGSILPYVFDLIVYYNDTETKSIEEIVSLLKTKSKSILNKKETFETYEWNNTNYQGVKL